MFLLNVFLKNGAVKDGRFRVVL